MKKKFAAILMASVMAATMFTACGDTPAPSSAENNEQSDAAEATVSDETFAIVQQNWASLTNFYNEAAMAYNTATSNGELERDENFENLMNQAADVLEQIQSLSQAELSEEEAVQLNDTMIGIQEQMSELLGVPLTE